MISIADVEHTIWSNDSFVRVQRTVVEPVVAVPHIALSLRGVDACGRWRDIVDKKVGDRPRDRVYRAEPDRRRRRWHCDTDTPNGTGCACWPGPIVTRSGNAYVPSGRPNPISAHVETVPGTARQIRVRIAFKCYKKFAQRRSPRPKVHSTHQTNGGPGRESSHREATFRVREKPV